MDVLIDVSSVTLLDFTPTLPCEGEHHKRGLSGHITSEPGAYLVTAPCCGPKVVQCAPRVTVMRLEGTLWCSNCNRLHLVSEYQFTPVDHL